MEEKLENLLCAIKIIKNYCERNENCEDCVLYDGIGDQCRITSTCSCPDSWDNPIIKKRTEIIA